MIRCACINDKDRPNDIPKGKWVKKGQVYTIEFAIVVLPQRELGLQLEEITLDESCAPYEYFLAHRFAFLKDDLYKLQEFIKVCAKINMSIKELMSQSNILNNA
jgi:hypothetical protein